MKTLALLSLSALISSSLLAPTNVEARQRQNNTMAIKLADGRTVTAKIARYHGTMMAMIDLSDVFHRPH